MADFRKISNTYPQIVTLLGYYSPNDGAYGQFLWVDTSTKADNGGTIIKPNDITGAGRYERFDEGYINVLWFGAKRNNSADASAAINNAITASSKYSTNWGLPSTGAGRVVIPSGIYKMSSPIVIRNTVTLEGGAGMFPYQETQLRYDGNVAGIDIRATTNGYGARMVIVKNLYLRNFGITTDSSKHGFFTNTRVDVENVAVDNFSGQGFAVITNDSGNANNSTFRGIAAHYNARNGFFASGNESNNMCIYSSDFTANGMCGVLDNSFLGNNFFGCHTSSNGLRNATGYSKSWCVYNGKVYQSIFYTNQKGIEPTVSPNWKNYWVENSTVFGANGIMPAQWNQDSVYWITGGYVVSGAAATTHLVTCYSEGGQGFNRLNQFSIAWGGDQGAPFVSKDNIWIHSDASRLQFLGTGIQVPENSDTAKSFVGLNNTFGIEVGSKKAGHGYFQYKYFESDRTAKFYADNSTGNQSFSLIGKGYDPGKLGLTVLPRTGMMIIPYTSGIFLGDFVNGNRARNFIGTTSKPLTGEHAPGDYAHNMNTDTSIVGWKNVTLGTPGNWKVLKSGNFMLGVYTPSSGVDPTGKIGDISLDNNYFYIKTNQGWKRTPLESF